MGSVVVLDCGGHTVKAGLAQNFPNEEEPRVVTPAALLASASSPANGHSPGPDSRPTYPVWQGAVTNWGAFAALLQHVLYGQLGWERGDEGSILMAEPLFTSKVERERLTQFLFEEVNVGGLFLAERAVLSLYAIGRTTGVVADLGHSCTDICMVLEGAVYLPGARRLPCGGRDLSTYLQRLLKQRGIDVTDDEAIEHLKEACSEVAENALDSKTAEAAEAQQIELPDGRSVEMRGEGLMLGEALLQPVLMGLDMPSMADAVYNCVMAHPDASVRKLCFESIVLCGGGSAMPGLNQRFLKEMRSLVLPSIQPSVCSTPEYMPANTLKHAVWMGGAVLSKVVFQQNQQITKFDYDEAGPAVVHRANR